MLSVIVYGRNDNHGYNMHKRIAISLNCIAEVLTHENDEILYVDYNTSNDLPSVIEAIADTLTDKAKKLTRVFRVREEIHARYKNKTHAQVNEPLARNIAIRRSNPQNKWILSTNTDMVFTILDDKKSLSDIVAEAKDGFYGLARFDVPEPMWESLDRKNPHDIISKFKLWGKSLHLNEVVYGNETIIYDAPGDFQLMLREDIFKIHGFDERMILGWHVDSNLCKRMKLLKGNISTMQDYLYGYHCNHTRLSGWAHSLKRKKENSIGDFFEKISSPYLPDQEKSWGLADAAVEEIKIGKDATSNFVSNLESLITNPLAQNFTESFYNNRGSGEIYYSTNHVAPFLLEQIALLPQKSQIVYVGFNQKMLEYLENFCAKNEQILHYYNLTPPESERFQLMLEYKINPSKASFINKDQINKIADLVIFDFGNEKPQEIKRYHLESFCNLLDAQGLVLIEIANEVSKKDFKVISINVQNSKYYKSVKRFFSPIQNPFITHIMVGRKVNARKILKNALYFEYVADKITNLLGRKGRITFLLISPFFIFYFTLVAIIKLIVKKYSLKNKLKTAQKKLANLWI